MCTLSLTSCKSMLSTVADKVENIQPGMTMDDVRRVMGKPDYRRFEQNKEVWEYRTRLIVDGEYDVVIVMFNDGIVTSMDSFREIHPKFPEPSAKSKAS